MLARQEPRAATRHVPAAGGPRPLHQRNSDRHRRDPGGASRGPHRHPRADQHGHVQEAIVQSRAKPRTRMAGGAEPTLDDHRWTIAVARLVLPPERRPGAAEPHRGRLPPPARGRHRRWGGVSPVTLDHVNPEAPWPRSGAWRRRRARGRELVPRLAVHPGYVAELDRWLAPEVPPRGSASARLDRPRPRGHLGARRTGPRGRPGPARPRRHSTAVTSATRTRRPVLHARGDEAAGARRGRRGAP